VRLFDDDVADAARRLLRATVALREDVTPSTLMQTVSDRDLALHDLAHLLGEPCPFCDDITRPVVATRPL